MMGKLVSIAGDLVDKWKTPNLSVTSVWFLVFLVCVHDRLLMLITLSAV